MFEKTTENNTENEENSYENNHEEFQKLRDEKLQQFYENMGDTAKQHRAELHSAVKSLFGDILEKMGK